MTYSSLNPEVLTNHASSPRLSVVWFAYLPCQNLTRLQNRQRKYPQWSRKYRVSGLQEEELTMLLTSVHLSPNLVHFVILLFALCQEGSGKMRLFSHRVLSSTYLSWKTFSHPQVKS